MKFTATVTAALMLANAALGSPLEARAAARGVGVRRTNLNMAKNDTIINGDNAQASENWAGIVLVNSGVTKVTGTFTVPLATTPPGGNPSTEYCGSAWIGIDGDTCQTGLIQTGVFWCVQNGQHAYEAWFEYIPASSVAYSGLTVTAGDVISLTVTKSDAHGGTTTLENKTTGVSRTHTFTNKQDGTLCGTNAEWIVEDFQESGSLVPFADFGTVTFTDATAVIGGQTVTASDNPHHLFIDQGNGALTSTTVSGSTVTVHYK